MLRTFATSEPAFGRKPRTIEPAEISVYESGRDLSQVVLRNLSRLKLVVVPIEQRTVFEQRRLNLEMGRELVEQKVRLPLDQTTHRFPRPFRHDDLRQLVVDEEISSAESMLPVLLGSDRHPPVDEVL